MVTYKAIAGLAELELLAQVAGKSVTAVCANQWSAALHTPHLNLLVTPEEVPTPTASHPYADIDRPKIQVAPTRGEAGALIAQDLGAVHEITLLRARVTFSDVQDVPETKILGAVVSPGREFGVVFLDPASDASVSFTSGAPLVVADIGIEFTTDRRHSITFFTRAVGHFVEVVVDDALPQDLLPYVRRHRVYSGAIR